MSKKITRIGIGGPVGSGKTAIVEAITPRLLDLGIKVLIITNDVVTTEDIADGLVGQLVAQVGHGSHNAVIAPAGILPGHPQDEGPDWRCGRRAAVEAGVPTEQGSG